jgi:hypothetical protein
MSPHDVEASSSFRCTRSRNPSASEELSAEFRGVVLAPDDGEP